MARRRERQEERGSFQHPFRKKLLRFTVRHLAVNQPGGKETRPPPPEDAFNAAANAALLSGFADEPPYAAMSVQVPVPLAVGSNLAVCADVIWTLPRTIKKATTKTIISFV